MYFLFYFLKTFLSTRSGSWVFNRISENGLPIDLLFNTRSKMRFRKMVGEKLFAHLSKKNLNKRFDHSLYGLKPDFPVTAQHPTINDDLPNRLSSGTLQVKPNIKRFTENGVEFDDGSKEDNIDSVIFATGYVIGFPFLDEFVLKVIDNKVELYKYVFPPNLEKYTLGIIGCIQPLGAINPISELQSRLATRVFKVAIITNFVNIEFL